MGTKPSIAYVGLGLMGLPMARRLVALGYRVRGYDANPGRVAMAEGVAPAPSVEAAVNGADLVLLNLPTTASVEEVAARIPSIPAQVVIDFSTIEPGVARALAARLRWVDAPVSGGPPAAAAGELTVMAGGADADIAAARPLLDDVCARLTHLGPAGSGLAAKMINQLLVGVGHAMMAEAVALAEAAGLDAARIPACLAGGLADSNLLQRFWPRMAAREFAPQGYARQLLKDLEMVHAFAGAAKAPAPMAAQALSLYRMLVHLGHGELDTTALVKLYEPR